MLFIYDVLFTWGVQFLRSPNFFLRNGSRQKRERCWRRRGCPLGWVRPSGNTVLPVECLWRGWVAVVFLILKWRHLHSKNSAWLSDPSTCVAWNPSKSINSWVRHAMMALWTWKMCVRRYDSSKKAERRVKTTRRSLSHALGDLKTWLREWNKWLWKTWVPMFNPETKR